MQQYRLEFFEVVRQSRKLVYRYHDFANDLTIDDDYLAIQSTTIEIGPTKIVKPGFLIRILRDEEDYFFGLVTDAAPGEYTTKVTFKPFVAIFDSEVVFDILDQYWSSTAVGKSLEVALIYYINAYFVSNSDYLQNYPITFESPSSTTPWNMYIRSDDDVSGYAVVNLYSDLIVRALKEYRVVVSAVPDFSVGTIRLSVGTVDGIKRIDASLDNVKVKTLKVNDRPDGLNKLIVHNGLDYSETVIFYVHPDRSWDIYDADRITPVSYGIKVVTPDENSTFSEAAKLAAYEDLNAQQWDNLIELELAPNDPLIRPTLIPIGQKVTIYQDGDSYTSILTGKNVSLETITLIFGSERITYTKRKR